MTQTNDDEKAIELKDTGYSTKFRSIKAPDEKIKFLGQQIRDIEHNIRNLEVERRKLLQNKECLIIELKNIINQTYQEKFVNNRYRLPLIIIPASQFFLGGLGFLK